MTAFAASLTAAPKVDFARDVQPVLHAHCAGCHSGEKPQAGLSVLTRSGLLKGGVNGPAVKPGSGSESLLVRRISVQAPRMPLGAAPLTDTEVATLRDWIDAGAVWETAGPPPVLDTRIKLRRPAVPEGTHANPVDAFVERYWRKHRIPAPPAVTDAVFARRVSFDVTGLPLDPDELDRFLADKNPEKRRNLIEVLLGRRQAYAEHWMSFWNDLLRNEDGVAFPGEKRTWITGWLIEALKSNMAYDGMVQSLLDPKGENAPVGFLAGVNWGGDVSSSQTPPLQAAQNSAQVFLGANLKCASCHDSFVSRWKLSETFGLAAFFSADPVEVVRCEVKTGVKAAPVFPFPELHEAPASTLPERRAQVARMFTSRENGRFPRTIVNRYWRLLFGRGIVEPADDLEAPAWDAGLLDWLASDFVEHGYDLQHLLRRILTSRTYQREAVRQAAAASADSEYVFRGPAYRRLTAEQFTDALSAITGEWKMFDDRTGKPAPYSRSWRFRSDALTRALGRPDRSQVVTGRGTSATMLQALELVNGGELRSHLRRGAKRLAGTYRPPSRNAADSGQIREMAGIEADITGAEKVWLVVSDFGSYDPPRVRAGWMDAEFAGPHGPAKLQDLPLPAGAAVEPIRVKDRPSRDALVAPLPAQLVYHVGGKGYTTFRASVGLDESGLRPEITAKVRFFVFTQEPDLDNLVRGTGEPPAARPSPGTSHALTKRLFRHAVARTPDPAELAEAGKLLRDGASGIEDLLWILALSPEFQFLR